MRVAPEVVEQAEAWRQVAATPPALPAVQPAVDTFATAGHLSASLDVETTRMLLGEVPAAFHAGIQDILLIAFALAVRGIPGQPAPRRSASTWRATAATKNWATHVDLSRTVGWFTTKYPVSLAGSVGCPGRRLLPGRRRWGR